MIIIPCPHLACLGHMRRRIDSAKWPLFCVGWHLSQSSLLRWRRPLACTASWPANADAEVRVVVKSMGGVFESLTFRCYLAGRCTPRFGSFRDVKHLACQDRRMGQ